MALVSWIPACRAMTRGHKNWQCIYEMDIYGARLSTLNDAATATLPPIPVDWCLFKPLTTGGPDAARVLSR